MAKPHMPETFATAQRLRTKTSAPVTRKTVDPLSMQVHLPSTTLRPPPSPLRAGWRSIIGRARWYKGGLEKGVGKAQVSKSIPRGLKPTFNWCLLRHEAQRAPRRALTRILTPFAYSIGSRALVTAFLWDTATLVSR